MNTNTIMKLIWNLREGEKLLLILPDRTLEVLYGDKIRKHFNDDLEVVDKYVVDTSFVELALKREAL